MQGDAHHGVLRVRVRAFEIVRVVGGDHLDADLSCQRNKGFKDAFLLLKPVILQFDVEVALGEHAFQAQRIFLRAIEIVLQKKLRDAPRKARRAADETFGISGESVEVYPRFDIEAVHERDGGELHQILISRLVFGEQDEVVAAVHGLGRLDVKVVRDVELAADDGLQPRLAHCRDKGVYAVEIAVIGDGARRHPHLFQGVDQRRDVLRLVLLLVGEHQLIQPYRAVQQAVFAVYVKVYEIAHILLSSSLPLRLTLLPKNRSPARSRRVCAGGD